MAIYRFDPPNAGDIIQGAVSGSPRSSHRGSVLRAGDCIDLDVAPDPQFIAAGLHLVEPEAQVEAVEPPPPVLIPDAEPEDIAEPDDDPDAAPEPAPDLDVEPIDVPAPADESKPKRGRGRGRKARA